MKHADFGRLFFYHLKTKYYIYQHNKITIHFLTKMSLLSTVMVTLKITSAVFLLITDLK